MERFDLVANLAQARRVTNGGRDYLVAPLTMIVPGVLPGSKGPLYYPPSQIARNFKAWGGIPVTVYHPFDPLTNEPLSASEPGVWERQGIGHIYNPHIRNRELKGEAWIDLDKANKVEKGREIINRIQTGQPIELSTGLFTENIDGNGYDHRGRAYDAVATNYRPDHLALLPDQVGACSLKDGCGVLVNAFCATGVGGGVDATCSPSHAGGGSGDWVKDAAGNEIHHKTGLTRREHADMEKMSKIGPGRTFKLEEEEQLERRGQARLGAIDQSVESGGGRINPPMDRDGQTSKKVQKAIAAGQKRQMPFNVAELPVSWNGVPILWDYAALNQFCPTGVGGGHDNSCGGGSGGGEAHGGHGHSPADKAHHEFEHGGHVAHTAHEGHEIAEALAGGHHEAVAAIHEAHEAHDAAHAAGEIGEHAGHSKLDAAAIVASHLYGPALKAASHIVDKVPGGARAAEAISRLHDGATKVAEAATSKLVERYGKATAGAILGSGSIMASGVMKGIGMGYFGKALPGKQFIGSIPLLAVAETGKRLGLVGPGTKLEKGLATVGTWVHATREAIGKPFKAVAAGLHEAGLKGAQMIGKATGRLQKDFASNELTVNLSKQEIDQAAEEFIKEIHAGFGKLIEKEGMSTATHDSEEAVANIKNCLNCGEKIEDGKCSGCGMVVNANPEGVNQYSKAASLASAKASKTNEASDYRAAGRAHGEAAKAHKEAGNSDKAEYHARMAKQHFAYARSEETIGNANPEGHNQYTGYGSQVSKVAESHGFKGMEAHGDVEHWHPEHGVVKVGAHSQNYEAGKSKAWTHDSPSGERVAQGVGAKSLAEHLGRVTGGKKVENIYMKLGEIPGAGIIVAPVGNAAPNQMKHLTSGQFLPVGHNPPSIKQVTAAAKAGHSNGDAGTVVDELVKAGPGVEADEEDDHQHDDAPGRGGLRSGAGEPDSGRAGTVTMGKPAGDQENDAWSPSSITNEHIGFDKLSEEIGEKGDVDDPDAVAAAIGRKKYGAAGMAKKAAAGRAHNAAPPPPAPTQAPAAPAQAAPQAAPAAPAQAAPAAPAKKKPAAYQDEPAPKEGEDQEQTGGAGDAEPATNSNPEGHNQYTGGGGHDPDKHGFDRSALSPEQVAKLDRANAYAASLQHGAEKGVDRSALTPDQAIKLDKANAAAYSDAATAAHGASDKAHAASQDINKIRMFSARRPSASAKALDASMDKDHAAAADFHNKAADFHDRMAGSGRKENDQPISHMERQQHRKASAAHKEAAAAHTEAGKMKPTTNEYMTVENANPEGLNQYSQSHGVVGKDLKGTRSKLQVGDYGAHFALPKGAKHEDVVGHLEGKGWTKGEAKDFGTDSYKWLGKDTPMSKGEHKVTVSTGSSGSTGVHVHTPTGVYQQGTHNALQEQIENCSGDMSYARNDRSMASEDAASASMHHPDMREQAFGALDAAKSKDPAKASKLHVKAAEAHEGAALKARQVQDSQLAGQHDRAAALHRQASSLHAAAVPQPPQGGNVMNGAQAKARLTANCKCDQDKSVINALSDEMAVFLVTNAKAEGSNADVIGSGSIQAGGEEDEDSDEGKGLTMSPAKAKGGVTGNKKMTDEEWLIANNAPPGIVAGLRRGQEADHKEKIMHVRRITQNVDDAEERKVVANKYMQKSLEELRETARLFPVENANPNRVAELFAPNYLGAAGFADFPTVNRGSTEEEMVLPLPTMNMHEIAKENASRVS